MYHSRERHPVRCGQKCSWRMSTETGALRVATVNSSPSSESSALTPIHAAVSSPGVSEAEHERREVRRNCSNAWPSATSARRGQSGLSRRTRLVLDDLRRRWADRQCGAQLASSAGARGCENGSALAREHRHWAHLSFSETPWA